MWRVMVVEDDPEMRSFFADSVSRCSDLALAASVGSRADALAWLQQHGGTLNVLLVDLGLPDGSGLDVIRFARQINPACEPLVISMFGDDANVVASIEAGALGYIHKDSTPDDIAETIRDMRAGASPISPLIARRILARFPSPGSAPSPLGTRLAVRPGVSPVLLGSVAEAHQPVVLSPREQQVLNLIARGYSYGEIAKLQQISVHTVQTHIKNLYKKLAVSSKTEAVYEATRMGLLADRP